MVNPTPTTSLVNGVNLEGFIDMVDAMRANPELAKFTFRANTEWITGSHSRTRIQGFCVAGSEDESRTRTFLLEGDEPPMLLGNDRGPDPIETVLAALGSSLVAGCIHKAAAEGIKVEGLEISLEAEIDFRGFFCISDRVRPGCQCIRLSYRIQSAAPRQKLEALFEHVQRTSPVLDLIRNPVPVTIVLQD